MTTRPFGSVYFSNLMLGRAIDADSSTLGEAVFVGGFLGGDFFAVSWLKTGTAATVTDRHRISKLLRSVEVIPILLDDCPTPYQTQRMVAGLLRLAKHY